MNIIYIDDLEQNKKQFLETLEGKNLNFLIGAGASMPYLKSLQFENTKLTFEDIFEESMYDEYDKKVYDYLCACFIYNSLIKGSYKNIKNDTCCNDIKLNYIKFVKGIYNILLTNSIQQPKRANIFTTNYDMFFEYSFDQIIRTNSNINFNDGSYGFVNKNVSASRFHTKTFNVGVDSRYEYEVPMLNLLKIHGSLNWEIDEDNQISVNNLLLNEQIFNERQILEINKLYEYVMDNNLRIVMKNIEENISDEYSMFSSLLEKLTIVKPNKKKFSETVLEEHYYQLLRILSQELERRQSVLICFGFSFCDEHIQSIVKRSLSNPNLLMYIVCYNKNDITKYETIFESYNNVKLIVRKDDDACDFSFFNCLLGGL